MTQPVFSERVLEWFRQYGRHDLPWQRERTLYRVWVAEIMLQQTQVATVIPYYERFLRKFPDLSHLIAASLDDVLVLWAGLGYYTRARNLYKAGQVIKAQYNGQFPQKFDDVLALPGIGRSTAGAILAQATGQRHVILDGNVKRVLSRYFAIEGWPGRRDVENVLWGKSEACTPDSELADYTQAMMDLGATVCVRRAPRCADCPLQANCQALQSQRTDELPASRPRKTLPVKATRLLLVMNEKGEVLLEKRPPSGIWGGLWSLPEVNLEESVEDVCRGRWGYSVSSVEDIAALRHTFSHFHLDITPCRVTVAAPEPRISEQNLQQWCNRRGLKALALAAPVAGLLQQHLQVLNHESLDSV